MRYDSDHHAMIPIKEGISHFRVVPVDNGYVLITADGVTADSERTRVFEKMSGVINAIILELTGNAGAEGGSVFPSFNINLVDDRSAEDILRDLPMGFRAEEDENEPLVDWDAIDDEFEYAAQDADGDVYVYSDEPEADEEDNVWTVKDFLDDFEKVRRGDPNPDWMNSLERRPTKPVAEGKPRC